MKPTAKQPCFALRFSAYGKRRYLTLGRPEDGWTLVRAERELAAVLRDVELGTWKPAEPDPTSQPPEEDVRFLEFSAEWLDAKVLEIEEETANTYRNDLRNHLIPFFKDHLVSAIDIKEVDRYRQHKVRENAVCRAAIDAGRPLMLEIVDKRGRRYKRVKKPLSPRSINMQIDVLQQILELAVEYDYLVPPNPAAGKRRRLKVTKARPVYLDSAEHIAVMLEAAADLDERDQVITVHDPRGRTHNVGTTRPAGARRRSLC